jgi:hypothetical protein
MEKRIGIGIIFLFLGFVLVINTFSSVTGLAIINEILPALRLEQILGFLFILTGLYLVSADAIRNARQHVPAGTFYAPDFYLKRDSNHGDGYHAHLYRTKDDQRTTIRVCYDGQKVYVEEHGRGVPVSLDRAVEFIRNNSMHQVQAALGRFKPQELAKPTKKAKVI